MGKLIITEPGKASVEYLVNTRTQEHVLDKACNDILKHFHPESVIDFIELF